jgi:hypothetical protein
MKPHSDRSQSQINSAVNADANVAAGAPDAACAALAKEAADLDLLRAYGCLDGLLYPVPDREPDPVSST